MQTTVCNSFLQLPCRPLFTTRFCSFHANHCLQLVFANSMQTHIYNSLLQLLCRPLLTTRFCSSHADHYYKSFLQLQCRPLFTARFCNFHTFLQSLGTRRCQFFSKRGRQILDAISIRFGWIGYKCHILNRTGVAIASFWLSLPLTEHEPRTCFAGRFHSYADCKYKLGLRSNHIGVFERHCYKIV